MMAHIVASRRTVVLVGLMGAGKTCIGRRLGRCLTLPFVDADDEIVKAAGASIPEIFRTLGESAFREGERRVIARLLQESPQVLATGGGAFIDPATRALIREHAVSIWLRADLDILVKRTSGRSSRPLLATDGPRPVLSALMMARYPIYAQADVVVDTDDEPADATTRRVFEALRAFCAQGAVPAAAAGGARA
jgi:shikimate kinase